MTAELRLQFDANQEPLLGAVESIVGLFEGFRHSVADALRIASPPSESTIW